MLFDDLLDSFHNCRHKIKENAEIFGLRERGALTECLIELENRTKVNDTYSLFAKYYDQTAKKVLVKGLRFYLLKQFASMNSHRSLKELILAVRDYENIEQDFFAILI